MILELMTLVCNNWLIYHRKSAGSGDLVVGKTFRRKDDLVNDVNKWNIAHSLEYQVQP